MVNKEEGIWRCNIDRSKDVFFDIWNDCYWMTQNIWSSHKSAQSLWLMLLSPYYFTQLQSPYYHVYHCSYCHVPLPLSVNIIYPFFLQLILNPNEASIIFIYKCLFGRTHWLFTLTHLPLFRLIHFDLYLSILETIFASFSLTS